MPPKISLVSFKFDNFGKVLSEVEVGSFVDSEKVTDCDGDVWKLRLFPEFIKGGTLRAAFALTNTAMSGRAATISIILRNARGLILRDLSCWTGFDKKGMCGGDIGKSLAEIMSKEKGMLVEGALVIDVMCQFHQVVDRFQLQCTKGDVHALPNASAKNMLKLLESEDDADVSFKVGDTKIHAHKLVLKMNSPDLFDFCEKADKGTSVPIEGVTPEVFRCVLRYIYGGAAPEDLMTKGKILEETIQKKTKILDVANRFGVIGLKLDMEASLVALCVIASPRNAVDILIFAHAKTCPLLKEYAIAYFVKRSKDILKSEFSSKLKESRELMEELLLEMSPPHTNIAPEGIQAMTVNELRGRLFEKGLDVDGSKETLISRLQSSNKRARDE